MNCKQKQSLIVLLTFVALVAAVANNAAWAQSTEWAVEVVDDGGNVGFYSDLAYDPYGNPAIAYATDYQVKFAYWNSNSWVIEPIGPASGNNGISLAYDGSQPTVSYTNDGLYFARRSGSGWDIELIDGSDDVLNRPVSLAYDNNGHPSISYCYCAGTNENKTVLKFAHYNGSSWDIEIVVDAPWTRYISLAYVSGNPAIAYMGMTAHWGSKRMHFVKLARWNGDSWYIETVDSIPDHGFHVDLAFDPDGLPSIVYCKGVEAVHFAQPSTSGWDSEYVGSGWAPSLAYDSWGTAFVSYLDWGEDQLKVAQRYRANDWVPEIVDWVGPIYYDLLQTSIALDPGGNPAVSYSLNHYLKFAWRDPSNVAPTVTITSPADGSTFTDGDIVPIVFNGTAIDAEDEDDVLTSYLTWTSDINGPIGSGGSFSTTLSVGRHIITASVTDSGGKTGSASVNITVGEQPTIHVEDIELSPGKAGKNYYAVVTVWIMDDVGADVEGATVYGQWSGAVSGIVSGVTDADGKVTGRSPKKKDGGNFIFTVTNVVASGCIYDEDLNEETSDSVTSP